MNSICVNSKALTLLYTDTCVHCFLFQLKSVHLFCRIWSCGLLILTLIWWCRYDTCNMLLWYCMIITILHVITAVVNWYVSEEQSGMCETSLVSQSVSIYFFTAYMLLFWQAPLVVCSAISSSVSSAESSSISSLGKRRLDGWPCTWYEVVPLWQTVLPCVRAWVQIAAVTLSVNSLRQTVHTHRASVTKQWNW